MKINSSSPIAPVAPAATEARGPERPTEAPTGAARVSLSGDAKWVAGVADEARKAPAIRMDVVQRIKSAVANGSWDQGVDLDRVVGNLLADL